MNNKMFDELTEKFDNLVKNDKLDINAVEELMLDDIENYKKRQKNQIEYLLQNHKNEKELINKNNESGKKEDTI